MVSGQLKESQSMLILTTVYIIIISFIIAGNFDDQRVLESKMADLGMSNINYNQVLQFWDNMNSTILK